MAQAWSLPIINPIKNFSPTSYMQADNCEFSYYLIRLSDAGLPRSDQTEPMAVGSAFDSFVKAEIAHSIGFENVLSVLLRSVDPKWNSAIAVGRKLFEVYRDCGAYDSLLKEGIGRIELDIKKGGKDEVILYGKPDAQIVDGKPLDWKVNGYASIHGAYAKRGYAYKFDRFGRHDGLSSSPNLEDIDEKWAIQLLFYNWLLDQPAPYTGAIDQVACKDGNVTIVCYRSRIGPAFADKVWAKVKDKWKRFQAGTFLVPDPMKGRCEPYGQPLICSAICPSYQQKFNSPGGGSLRDQVTNSGRKK